MDTRAGSLLDVIPGGTAAGAGARFEWAPLDLSGPYRLAINTMVPRATQGTPEHT